MKIACIGGGPAGLYFAIAMNRYGGFGWGRSVLLAAGFLVAMIGLSAVLRQTVGHLVGGSQSYFPALVALIGVGLWLDARAHPAGRWLVAVAGLFAVSLTLRTLDGQICADVPLGTHWLWHLMNSAVLGTLMVALIRHGRKPA